jgi:hypothetical protein
MPHALLLQADESMLLTSESRNTNEALSPAIRQKQYIFMHEPYLSAPGVIQTNLI